MRVFKRSTPNNNKEAVRILARAELRCHRGRAAILAGTAALSIVVLCTVFSITLGKFDAEYLQSVRSAGTAATTYLERGTEKQYEAIRKLDYIEAVGKVRDAGDAYAGEKYISDLQSVDSTLWERMLKPAYAHIHGRYPEKDGEIMFPVRALEALGIGRPEIGTEISLTVLDADSKETKEVFSLCGWYTDYVDPAVSVPMGYISEEQLRRWGMSLDEPDLLAILQKDVIDRYEIEEKLYEDIPTRDKSQRFIGGNTYAFSVMNDFAGGYKMASFCGMLVLASVFFLIQNVLAISLQKEIRQIGLLDTLGMTKKQIQSLYFRQTAVTLLLGTAAGSGCALLVILILVPQALGNLYLYNFGRAAELMVFRPGLFAAAILFTAAVILTASKQAVYKASELSPMEALHYTGMSEKTNSRKRNRTKKTEKRKKKRPVSGNSMVLRELIFMAWQNLARYRKRFFLTALSLFLGVTTALASVVLAKGTDYTNAIETRSDFVIGGNPLMETKDMRVYRDDFSPIDSEVKRKLLSVAGVKEKSIETVRGAYLVIDIEEPVWEPFAEIREEEKGAFVREKISAGQPASADTATIQIVDDEYMDVLEEYVSGRHLKADIESLRAGTGMLMLHYHMLSPALTEEADRRTGSLATLWKLPSAGENEEASKAVNGMDEEEFPFHYRQSVQMEICGYLDTEAKGFPKLQKTWFGPGVRYLLVSERGFLKLGTKEKTFSIEFDTERNREPSAKAAVRQILQEENRKYDGELLYVNCKSDELTNAKSYILTNRIIMGALSLVLILMGLLNYFNVLVTGMFARQKELAVMESVGMTGKQVRGMLVLEGGIYWGILLLLVLTAGSGILNLIHIYMDTKIAYFKFYYPWKELFLILSALLVICIGAFKLVHRRMERQSLTLRIGNE